MIDPNDLWNSPLFSREELERFEMIEKEPRTGGEKFLCGLIEHMFYRIAMLKDELTSAKEELMELN